MSGEDHRTPSDEELSRSLAIHGESFLGIPGVVGTGIGERVDGGPTIHIYVTSQADPAVVRRDVGRILGDLPVEVIEMGTPQAGADPAS